MAEAREPHLEPSAQIRLKSSSKTAKFESIRRIVLFGHPRSLPGTHPKNQAGSRSPCYTCGCFYSRISPIVTRVNLRPSASSRRPQRTMVQEAPFSAREASRHLGVGRLREDPQTPGADQ